MQEFTLEEARAVLSAVIDLAPNGLVAPLTDADQHVLAAAGIEIKSADDGLIDFPAHIEGQPAYWCWRAGEAAIAWWHPRAAGFAGRRPV